MEGAQNRQLQYQKPTFSGLKGQQKRSGVAGASAGPCFSMLKQNIAGESQAGRGSQKNSGGCYKGGQEGLGRVAISGATKKPRNAAILGTVSGCSRVSRQVSGRFQGGSKKRF